MLKALVMGSGLIIWWREKQNNPQDHRRIPKMNSYDFDDQVAVITGGAQGIGRSCQADD